MTDDTDTDSDAQTEQKLQELQEQTQRGTRLQQSTTLTDRIEEAFDELEDGDLSKSISMYDPRLAALIYALEDDEARMKDIVANLQRELGRDVDVDDVDRSELLRLITRVGLEEAAPDLLDEARTAYQRHVSEEF